MTVILMGSLSRFPAIEVVGFIVDGGKSGVLSIEAGGGYRVRFESGRITGAVYESPGPDSTTADIAVRAMLQENGMFTFADAKSESDGKVDLDPRPLIGMARQRIDESEAFDPSLVFFLARDLESSEMFSANEVRVLCDFDGRASAREVVTRCGLSEATARRVIGSLIRRGWLISREGSKQDELPVMGQSIGVEPPAAGKASSETVPDFGLPRAGGASSSTEASQCARIACFTLDDTNSTSYPLFDEVHTIGRARHNTIRIEDKSVSSTHARISRTAEGHLLEDLESSNGTFVNGKRIDRAILRDKDRIRLGTMFMVYMIPAEVSRQSTEQESPP